MKKNIKNKEYTMEEATAYYILGYKRYLKNKEKKRSCRYIKKYNRNCQGKS